MGHKRPNTPRSRIRAAIRQVWLRSRERVRALKSTKYCCTKCGAKQSKAKGREVKVQVHHDPPIDNKWEEIINLIVKWILEAPQIPLCKDCHDEEHGKAGK